MDIVDFMIALALRDTPALRCRGIDRRAVIFLARSRKESRLTIKTPAIRELPYGSFLIALCAVLCVTET
jgi:hypothetical protein